MSIKEGIQWGPYRIAAKIGSGGMGEVYKAIDTRLNRTVALKVLSRSLRERPDLSERFHREAQVVASLNHPHICTLFDIGEHEGTQYLVMEYLEGDTLAERLERGPLTLDEAVRHAIQLANALDTAHRAGITHRDLKPGNIILTPSGPKLLDFGLAKVVEDSRSAQLPNNPSASSAPTKAFPLTTEGMILGTPEYMAPEQLEGKAADARTDIFALGVVLYEMVSGRRAFEGTNRATLISAILTSTPPPISALQQTAPPLLDWILRTCLAKNPDDRWQTARDLAVQLRWITEEGAASALPAVSARPKRNIYWMTSAAGILVTIAVIAGLSFLSGQRARQLERVEMLISDQRPGISQSLAFSPDGRKLAWVGKNADGAGSFIWIRSIDDATPTMLLDTDGAEAPFWAPDSRRLAFFAKTSLKIIDVTGGPSHTICPAPTGRGGSWNSDGVILFGSSTRPLQRVADTGGTPQPVTVLNESRLELTHAYPQFLPDGRTFLFLAEGRLRVNNGIFLGSLDSPPSDVKFIASSDTKAIYSNRLLFFLRQQTLMAQPFDIDRAVLTSTPETIADNVNFDRFYGEAYFTVSDTGAIAYWSGIPFDKGQLTWFDRKGEVLRKIGDPEAYANPMISPDSRHVAVELDDGSSSSNIWIIDSTTGAKSRFTFNSGADLWPVWSPDGNWIAFSSAQGGQPLKLLRKRSNGAGDQEILAVEEGLVGAEAWGVPGLLSYLKFGSAGIDVWTVSALQDLKTAPLLHAPQNELQSQFSPDGRWIAYASDETGRYEIFVQSYPPTGAKWQISNGSGVQPRWRRDGRELFFLTYDQVLMSADVQTGQNFQYRTPHRLQGVSVSMDSVRNSYDVSPDGEAILINVYPRAQTVYPIRVILNWRSQSK